MRRLLLLSTVLATLLAPSGVAHAQDCIAPPGTAAVDEYCETVPQATGDRGSPAPPRAVSPATLAALRRAGADGTRLADQLDRRKLAQDPNRRHSADPPVARGRAFDTADGSEPGSNPLDAVRSAVQAGARIDSATGWVLLLITIAFAGAWWVGVRSGRGAAR